MKRVTLIALALLLAGSLAAQVFNTGQTLKPKSLSVGFQPAVLINDGSNFVLFLHGGVGIKQGIDIGLTAGVLGPHNYFGADIEFAVGKRMSVVFGAHHFGSFGLGGTFIVDMPIRKDIRLFTGVDVDLNIHTNSTQLLVWLPIGLEIALSSSTSLIFETQVGLTAPAYHLIGIGLNFYL